MAAKYSFDTNFSTKFCELRYRLYDLVFAPKTLTTFMLNWFKTIKNSDFCNIDNLKKFKVIQVKKLVP